MTNNMSSREECINEKIFIVRIEKMNNLVVDELRKLSVIQKSFVMNSFYHELEDSLQQKMKNTVKGVGNKEFSFFLMYQGYYNLFMKYPHSTASKYLIDKYMKLEAFHDMKVYDPIKRDDFDKFLEIVSTFSQTQILLLCHSVISRLEQSGWYGEPERNDLLQNPFYTKEDFDKISLDYTWWAKYHGYEDKNLLQDKEAEGLKKFAEAGFPKRFGYFPLSIPLFNLVTTEEYDDPSPGLAVNLIERGDKMYSGINKVPKEYYHGMIQLGEQFKVFEERQNLDINVVDVHVTNLRKIGYDNLKLWMDDPNNLYAGRSGRVMIKDEGMFGHKASLYANPYTAKTYGLEQALKLYENDLYNSQDPKWIAIRELAKKEIPGKNLGCWCPSENICHCGILKKFVQDNY
jgi:hypothetical protein